MHPKKINYTYHRALPNIHSRLARTHSSQSPNLIDPKNLTLQYSTHDALSAEPCKPKTVLQDIAN